jgi:hypothetical protein
MPRASPGYDGMPGKYGATVLRSVTENAFGSYEQISPSEY